MTNDCGQTCKRINSKFISHYCSTKSIISMKVIRFCNIDDILILSKMIPDLKIIFQFRDPRGTFNSRKNLMMRGLVQIASVSKLKNFRRSQFIKQNATQKSTKKITFYISPIHTFVNIPALMRTHSVFLSSTAGIFTKV